MPHMVKNETLEIAKITPEFLNVHDVKALVEEVIRSRAFIAKMVAKLETEKGKVHAS